MDFLHRRAARAAPICMQPDENQDKPSLVILFRSKLTEQAGEDYQAMTPKWTPWCARTQALWT